MVSSRAPPPSGVAADWLASRQSQRGLQPAEAGAPERDGTAVEARQIAHDRQPQAGSRHLLIEPRPRGESMRQLLRRQARAIVLDRDRQATIVAAARRGDPATGPLAGIVHQVAEHLLEAPLLPPEDMLGRAVAR